MVVFTCAHCGESLQKPKVEKHYETKCRGNFPDVCCMDCLKDFRGDEFKVHTKCVSEAERYGGKGFVPKPGQNKGEQKQNAWIEIVQDVIGENKDLPRSLQILLEKVSNQPNTPRKQSKFINFIKSMDKRASPNDIDRAWALLSAKLELIKTKPPTKKENSEDKPTENGKVEAAVDVPSQDNESNENQIVPTMEQNGKKKKNKTKIDAAEESSQEKESNEDQSVPAVQKSGKKRKSEAKVEAAEDPAEESQVVEAVLSKKEKKEKKKREKYEAELRELEQKPIADNANENAPEEQEISKKKSKKRKQDAINGEAEIEIAQKVNGKMEVNEPEEPKKAGKKRKHNEETNGHQEADEKIEEPSVKKLKDAKEEFDWSDAIMSVLTSKGKDIALKKLQKKVLTEYCVRNDVSDVSDRINKKFMKSLKKIENVCIANEKVSLKC